MSKKHKKFQNNASIGGASLSEGRAVEYGIIKYDLIKVLILNAIYLACVLILYFTNQRTQYLEHWLGKLFRF